MKNKATKLLFLGLHFSLRWIIAGMLVIAPVVTPHPAFASTLMEKLGKVEIDPKNIYLGCKKDEAFFLSAYEELKHQRFFWHKNQLIAVLRLEHFKTVFTKELEYLERISTDVPQFESLWNQFRTKWLTRFQSLPEMVALDKNRGIMGANVCVVHSMFGLDCENNGALDILSMKKQEVIEKYASDPKASKAQVKSTAEKLPVLYRSLLLMSLLKNAQIMDKPSEQEIADASPELKLLLTQERDFPQNDIFRMFPELYLSGSLSRVIDGLLWKTTAITQIHQKIEERREAQTPNLDGGKDSFIPFNDKIEIAESFVSEKLFNMPQVQAQQDMILKLFEVQLQKIFEVFDDNFERGMSDPRWLLQQDYIVARVMRWSEQRRDAVGAGIMQTIICRNSIEGIQSKADSGRMQAILGLFAGGAVLVSFFSPPGIATVLLLAGLGVGLPLSFTQLIQSSLSAADAREQLVFHNMAIQEVEAAELDYIKSLPWFALNLVPIPGVVFIRQCAKAEKAALAVGDLAKAKSMRSYRFGVIAGLVTMGAGISTMQVPDSYHMFKTYFKKLKEKEEKLKAGKP